MVIYNKDKEDKYKPFKWSQHKKIKITQSVQPTQMMRPVW